MKLTVRLIDSAAVQGEKALALCDESGAPLPNQHACAVISEIGEFAIVTARFFVDGDGIRFA